MGFADLPTMAEVAADRVGKPIPKPRTRLQETVDARKLTLVDDKAFKAAVTARDGNRCRCCGRKVLVTMARVPERKEVHHIHGKRGDLRFEPRAACVLCLTCHERVTGRVNDRLAIIASKTFTIRQGTFTDATAPVQFKKVA